MEQNDEKLSMTRQDIEQHLQSALAAATPNVWPKLDLSVPQDKPESIPGVLRLEKRFRHWGAVAACICLIAAGGIYHYEYLQVVSVVGIDVNPSLRLSLNRREKVLKAEALNLDGETVLEKELKGKNLESALGQVVDSLVEKGYLREGLKEQAVLVSVSGKNEKKAEAVKAAAAANVEDAISQNQVSAVVYDQTIQVTKELEELAETYQVSVGKAGFIEQLVQENETLNQDARASYERMMSQSMEVIAQEINANAYAVNAKVNVIQVEPADEKSAALTQKDESSKEDSGKSPSLTENVRNEAEGTKKEEGKNNSTPETRQPETESYSDKEKLPADKEKGTDKEDEKEPEKEGAEKEDTQENTRDKDAGDDQVNKGTSNGQIKDSGKTDKQENGQMPEEEEFPVTEKDEQESLETKDLSKETGEATSSTVGAETESQEQEEKEDSGNKDSLEGEEEDFFVKYGQSVKDELWLGAKDSTDSAQELSEGDGPEDENTIAKIPENEPFLEKELEDDTSIEDRPEEDNSLEKEAESETFAENAAEGEAFVENRPEDSKTTAKIPEDKDVKEEITQSEDDIKRIPEHENTEGEASEDSDMVEKQPEGSVMAEEPPEDNDMAEELPEDNAVAEGQPEDSDTEKEKSEDEDAARKEPAGDDAVKEEFGEGRAEETLKLPADETVTAKEPVPGESAEGESGHQIIRVKVEKKVWKEPEEPVYASQLLGFSQSRLLCKGPGVFDFIIADPGTKDKEGKGPEDNQETLESDEAFVSEEDDEVLFPDTEENEETEDAVEEWEAEMGEWLHIGPGYHQ
ncbi:MAG: hypothetical protein HFG51_15170 [Lachnospiraceae bacterium]|nr:hypothetical protein [Lachnospiraceae bacterium]